MHAIVHGADVQDRDDGVLLMATLFGLYPFLLKLYADGGYQGAQFQDALGAILKRVNVEIVKRSDQAQRFVVLPKRWIVERTFAWLGRCRRLAKDWECLNRKALAFLKLASIRLMTRNYAIQDDVSGQTLRVGHGERVLGREAKRIGVSDQILRQIRPLRHARQPQKRPLVNKMG